MKAITILQPFAHLICLPESDPRHKRVENRTWPTKYRGPLVIHAGQSRKHLSPDELLSDEFCFGRIVATCDLIACLPIDAILIGSALPALCRPLPYSLHWLYSHEHTEGPWCWVLANVKPLANPIRYRGAQRLFEIPDSVLATGGTP